MLANGDGGEKNLARADEWFRKAAEQNHRDAQFRLAVACMAGQGMETNDVEGLHWLRRAADGGWPLAEYVLGSYYSTGKHGILKDPEQSVRWIQRSAEHGNSQAQFHLASNYLYGQDVPKDMLEAVRWFWRAAAQGHAEAQNSIGYACETGATGETNVVEAYMWYQLAVRQGEARSQVNLKRLLPRLAPEQISEGNRRFQEFKPRPAELPNPLPMQASSNTAD